MVWPFGSTFDPEKCRILLLSPSLLLLLRRWFGVGVPSTPESELQFDVGNDEDGFWFSFLFSISIPISILDDAEEVRDGGVTDSLKRLGFEGT